MTDPLVQMALALSASPSLSVLVKATLIVVLALAIVRSLRRASAPVRHLTLAIMFAALLALPAAAILVPPMTIAIGLPQSPPPPSRPLIAITGVPTANRAARLDGRAQQPDVPVPPSVASVVGVVWGLGLVITLFPLALMPLHLRRLARAARPWPAGRALATALAFESGTTRRVAVLVHPGVSGPLAYGLARPRIVLPRDAVEWSDAEIGRALTHELAHIRRADWAIQFATRIVCSLYWFHPLVWRAWRQLCLEAERACDDAVLRTGDRTAYAQQLVTLARRRTTAALPVLSMACRSDLTARVAAVLNEGQARRPVDVWRASAVLVVAAALVISVAPLRAGSPPAVRQAGATGTPRPEFEVASIRRNTSGEISQFIRNQGNQVTVTNWPVRGLIRQAYGLQIYQLVGGPSWLDTERWDIIAKVPANVTPPAAGAGPNPMMLMAQRLLEDRFKLRTHVETRQIPVYALVLAQRDGQLGPRFQRSTVDCGALSAARGRGDGPPPTLPERGQPPQCGAGGMPGRLFGGGVPTTQVARMLSGAAGRAVYDATGLDGLFGFDLEFAPVPDAQNQDPPAQGNAPSLFTAVEEQLGLKLEPRTGPVDVLVIDSVERPTEN